MIAVSVHEMISVTSELLAKLLQDLLHLMLREVRVPKVQTLFVFKLLSQLSRLPRTGEKFVIRRNHDHRSLDLPDVKNSRKWKRMAAISVLPPVHLQTGVVDSHTEVAGVVVCPEHVVDVEDHWLPGHVQY